MKLTIDPRKLALMQGFGPHLSEAGDMKQIQDGRLKHLKFVRRAVRRSIYKIWGCGEKRGDLCG